MTYPCIMRDSVTGQYFVAGDSGPITWKYHKSKIAAFIELLVIRYKAP